MSVIYDEVYLTESDFIEEFDKIVDSLTDETNTVWIIDQKVVFNPVKLFEELTSTKLNMNVEVADGTQGTQTSIH